MRGPRSVAKLLAGIALLGYWGVCRPVCAQTQGTRSFPLDVPAVNLGFPSMEPIRPREAVHFHVNWMPDSSPGYIASQTRLGTSRFQKVSWSAPPSTIEKMESAFYCNDTPFVDQVRLPLATFWNGRVKLIGFESDITTANFVLGLPGQGSLHSLSAFGNAFVATHTPPSDQLAGINMIFSLRPTDTDAGENSGRRGIEYLVRASRGFLPFFGRSESISSPAH